MVIFYATNLFVYCSTKLKSGITIDTIFRIYISYVHSAGTKMTIAESGYKCRKLYRERVIKLKFFLPKKIRVGKNENCLLKLYVLGYEVLTNINKE